MGKNDYGSSSWGSGWARQAFGGAVPGGRPPAMGPGRRVVFKPDHKSFGEFILSEQMRDVTVEVATDISALAGQYAPRSKGRKKGTPMADRFRVKREAGAIKVAGNLRVKVEVFNEDSSAAPNEFGGRRNPRHRMLGRAGAAFGDFKPRGGEA